MEGTIYGFYLKPSRRHVKLGDSTFRCFDLYDQDRNRIPLDKCDVVDIRIDRVDFAYISMEIVDGMIHVWSGHKLTIQPLINTLSISMEQ